MLATLAAILAAMSIFFGHRWLSAERQCREAQMAGARLSYEYAAVTAVLDSLRAAISSLDGQEPNAPFWYEQAKRARESQGMLLGEVEIEILQTKGLDDPVNELRDDLAAHTELIPYEGVRGGKMRFVRHTIAILSTRWVYAEFEDGHVSGDCLLEYDVGGDGTITWKMISAGLD
jgi:hypothetical protein